MSIGDSGPGQLPGHVDQYYNNTCVLNRDNTGHYDYGRWDCSGPQDTWPILGNNTIYTLSSNAMAETGLCGQSEAAFQQKYPGVDDGTKIATASPTVDAQLIQQAKSMLFV